MSPQVIVPFGSYKLPDKETFTATCVPLSSPSPSAWTGVNIVEFVIIAIFMRLKAAKFECGCFLSFHGDNSVQCHVEVELIFPIFMP